MNLTLRQLRIFSEIVDCQSITKASERLHLSQPAVSIQLKKLQNQFDSPLTEVVGRQLYVTDFGREIAGHAARILAEVDAIDYNIQTARGHLAGRLRLSVVSTAKYVMPYFLADFMHRHPAVDLTMDVTNKRHVVTSLEENAVDFAMVSVLPDHLKLDRVPLMKNKLYLVGGTRDRGAGRPGSLRTLGNFPLLFREPGSATRAAMTRYLTERKIPTNKRIELTSNEALKQAIVAGLGYSVMPLIGIKNELRNGDLEILSFPGLPIVTEWNLVWQPSKNLSPVAEAYLHFVRAEKERIIGEQFRWFEEY